MLRHSLIFKFLNVLCGKGSPVKKYPVNSLWWEDLLKNLAAKHMVVSEDVIDIGHIL